jgi:DNA-directed RNA polymerase specialized sigma24 family protein
MKKNWVLTQQSFDGLLAWLNPDREQAGARYEHIRSGLIKIFSCRGCIEPEDLSDEVINRVINKLPDVEVNFAGDPERYFFGVANKVFLEYLRRKPAPVSPAPREDKDQLEPAFKCLEVCMTHLTAKNRELVLEYYQEEKRAKIEHRRFLAEKLGIAANALRIRAHRIRASLEKCVFNCLDGATHETKPTEITFVIRRDSRKG